MARKSEKSPLATLKRTLAPKGPDFDFIRYDETGDDPRPYVEVPEGAEVESCQNSYTDSIGAVYDVDGEDGNYVAVLVIAIQGPSAAAAAAAMTQDAGGIASNLFSALADDRAPRDE